MFQRMRSSNPFQLLAMPGAQRYLLVQLVKRDVLLRYRGAYFGLLWVLLHPLLMLGVFVFVFGYIFQSRWPMQYGETPFALILFAGLIPFNLFSESVSRAPLAVRSQPSYVKKIIFPVEILPMVPLGAALFQTVFNLLILTIALAWTDNLSLRFLLYPVMLVPVMLLGLGCAWFVASWGVFVKDVSQVVPVVIQVLFFLSPVLYSATMVPDFLQPAYLINPLAPVIEACRSLLVAGTVDWLRWLYALASSAVVAVLGYMVFQRQRDEFADVL